MRTKMYYGRILLPIICGIVIWTCKKEHIPVDPDVPQKESVQWMPTGNNNYWINKLQFGTNRLFIATDGDGLFYSTDNALTFRTVNIPGGSFVEDIEISGSVIITTAKYYSSNILAPVSSEQYFGLIT